MGSGPDQFAPFTRTMSTRQERALARGDRQWRAWQEAAREAAKTADPPAGSTHGGRSAAPPQPKAATPEQDKSGTRRSPRRPSDSPSQAAGQQQDKPPSPAATQEAQPKKQKQKKKGKEQKEQEQKEKAKTKKKKKTPARDEASPSSTPAQAARDRRRRSDEAEGPHPEKAPKKTKKTKAALEFAKEDWELEFPEIYEQLPPGQVTPPFTFAEPM